MQFITNLLHNFAAACTPGEGGLFLPTWYKYLGREENLDTGKCTVVMTFPDDIGKILLAVVEIILRVGGIIAVGFVIYGGFRYITSQGEPENTKSARQTITNALIGLVITTIATVSVAFIGNKFI
jgi:hypothetical protein